MTPDGRVAPPRSTERSRVANVRLVRDAEDDHRRTPNREPTIVQRLRDPIGHVPRSLRVDVLGLLEDPELPSDIPPNLPREIGGIEGDAVPPDAGAGEEGHE